MTRTKKACHLFLWTIAFLLMGVSSGQALLMTHSEAHISNIQIIPLSGDVFFYFDPWFAIAGAGAFDDPSGWDADFDDDFDMNGEASASASTLYSNVSAAVSANGLTIDVVGDVAIPVDTPTAFNSYGFGELYNVFEVIGPDPIDAQFSFDWSTELTGQASAGTGFTIDFEISMIISDGFTDWHLGTYDVSCCVWNTSVNQSNADTLADIYTLQPGTLYSVDFFVGPEPSDCTKGC